VGVDKKTYLVMQGAVRKGPHRGATKAKRRKAFALQVRSPGLRGKKDGDEKTEKGGEEKAEPL